MKQKATVFLILALTLFMASCVEIDVKDVQRIELIDFNPPGVINVGDNQISLDSAKLNVYIEGEGEPEVLALSNEDVTLSGTGYDNMTNALKTASIGTYTLKVSYGDISVTLTYRVYGTDVRGVGPHDKYSDLQEAIDAAQEGDTIQLAANYDTSVGYVVRADDIITLNLAGHILSGYSEVSGSWALITNHGSLAIEDTSENQTGKITTQALHPDMREIPGYASNTITNQGILTVNSGIVENTTDGVAVYSIDNQSTSRDVILTINGGHIVHTQNKTAIRQFANSTTYANTVIVNDGLIEGSRAVWIHLPGNAGAEKIATLIVNGGTLRSTNANYYAVTAYTYGDSYARTTIEINGGTWNGSVILTGGTLTTPTEVVTVSGGQFDGTYGVYSYGVMTGYISGGYFNYVLPEQIAVGYTIADSDNDDYLYMVVPSQ